MHKIQPRQYMEQAMDTYIDSVLIEEHAKRTYKLQAGCGTPVPGWFPGAQLHWNVSSTAN
jgi:hypothetical protein